MPRAKKGEAEPEGPPVVKRGKGRPRGSRRSQMTVLVQHQQSPLPLSQSQPASAVASRESSVAPQRDDENARAGTPQATRASSAQPAEPDADVDEDDEPDDFGTAAMTNAGAASALATDDEKERLRILLESFNEEQMQRYEVFRRANLNKGSVKRLANQILNQSINTNIAIVIAGFGKVFVGDIVESAKQVQADKGESGPLTPDHIREAYRRYRRVKPVPQQPRLTSKWSF